MNISIVFGQRGCSYPGEFAPEALFVADEWTMSDNPDWIKSKLTEVEGWNEYESVEAITIDVGRAGLEQIKIRLDGNYPAIPGTIG
jgi:hypothetical protein